MASLYLHIPFCEKKCLYCDFYSIENASQKERFVKALLTEIDRAESSAGSFETVFFGGGTPSLLEPRSIEAILSRLRRRFTILPDAEITLEVNPGTVSVESLREFRSLGVNRLSIGIQSLVPSELEFLSRIHDRRQALRCIDDAREAGFENFSVDLIYALPGQTSDRWMQTLRPILALEPPHLSAYGLIVEPQTPLASLVAEKLVTPAPAEREAELYELTMEECERAGYHHYEVSSYARPERECRHKRAYWSRTPYLGFGPSAHSYASGGPSDGVYGRRWWNVRDLGEYFRLIDEGRRATAGSELLTAANALTERVFLGLRSGGVDLGDIAKGFGRDLAEERRGLLAALVEDGLVIRKGTWVQLTRRGYLLCDEICRRLLGDS